MWQLDRRSLCSRVCHDQQMPEDQLADLLAAADMTEVGHRIRQARVTQGLTQGQLAGGEISIGYVSRIESGKRRPDPSLGRLAARLHVSPIVLLRGGADPVLTGLQVALDHAELSLRGGSPAEAQRQLEAIWPDLVACGVPDLEGRGRLTRALTLEALGLVDDAIIELEDLVADGPHEGAGSIRAAIALSRCYRESGDLARAIETGESHLETLRRLQLEGSDEAIQLVVTVAAAHHERGDVAHALRLCSRAIHQAEHLDSPVAKASAYWNASLFEADRGAVDAAVPLAAKALQLMETAEDNRNLARLRTCLGWLQLLVDPPQIDEARATLRAASAELLGSSASPVDLGRNALGLARAELLAGNIRAAEEQAASVLEQARGSAPLLTAEVLMLLGQAAAIRGDAESAAEHYREVVLQLSAVGADRSAARAWFELGALLDELGLEGEAHDAYRSAAASTGLAPVYSSQRRRVQPG